jgi:diguanylate cyclase (GGDEF)-like protein/PAS domain S-box-containing protein
MLSSSLHADPAPRLGNWVTACSAAGLALLGYALLWGEFKGLDLQIPHYTTLHTAMETMAIVIAMMAFGIVWNAYARERPANIVFIGIVLFGTGLLDFAHMVSVLGMPAFVTAPSMEKSISFWLAARYLPAIGLLVMAMRHWEPLKSPRTRYVMLIGVLSYVLIVYGAVLFKMEVLPLFFVQGLGLTPLKIAMEYLLVAMYSLAALLFFLNSRNGPTTVQADLFAAAAIAAISELCFTLYSSHGDLFNTAGHIYKVAGYIFIYRALFLGSVRQPFEALHSALYKEKRFAAEQLSFVKTLDLLEEAVLQLDLQGQIVDANAGWWSLMGTPQRDFVKLSEFIHPEERRTAEQQISSLAVGEKEQVRARYRFQARDRDEIWMECHFVTDRDERGTATGARGVLRDITKSYLQERHINHMTLHDALTNLPNRVLLEDRIRQAIRQAINTGKSVGVCFLDLDHFKKINDAYGHRSGDRLLLTLSQILKRCLREGDTLARWGGDEFAVLLPDLSTVEAARQVAEKMFDQIRQTLTVDTVTVNLTCSMGIALYPNDEDTGNIEALLSKADRAMFYAKAQGRNNYQLFGDMTSKDMGKDDLHIQARLAQAIRDTGLSVWYQALVAAEPNPDGSLRLVGVEALARWHDPELGWVPPYKFVAMAEELGLISELGQQVRLLAFDQFSKWLPSHPKLTLSINISKRQLFATDFVNRLMADLATHGLQPGQLVLEITESVALMDVDFAEDRLRQLNAMGFSLSIDDFGTGYASLSQLHDLPVRELKIDMSFVRRIHTNEGLRMVQGIVSLAQALGLRTVAEGVQNVAAVEALRKLKVDVLQGYHFAQPCAAEVFETLVFFRPSEVND